MVRRWPGRRLFKGERRWNYRPNMAEFLSELLKKSQHYRVRVGSLRLHMLEHTLSKSDTIMQLENCGRFSITGPGH